MDAWRLAVLVPPGSSAGWQQLKLQAALEEVVQPLALDWHRGERAGSLAQYFGVESLPGAVLVPPYCRVIECEVRLMAFRMGGPESDPCAWHNTLVSSRCRGRCSCRPTAESSSAR